VVLQEERHNQALAEESFRGAIELAHTQGALFWELRAALSTARLRVWQEDRADAALVLQPVFDRFTEGFAVTDLQSAKALLNSLQ
jgi:predicted ATPase